MQGGRERPAKDQSGEEKQGFRVILLRFGSKGAFSALAKHFFWHPKKGPFSDPQGRPKERVLLGSGSKTDNLDAFFLLAKNCDFCVFFCELWRGKIWFSHYSVVKNHEFSWGRNLAPTRVTWVRPGGGSTGTSFERGCSDCSFAGGAPSLSTQTPGPRKGH